MHEEDARRCPAPVRRLCLQEGAAADDAPSGSGDTDDAQQVVLTAPMVKRFLGYWEKSMTHRLAQKQIELFKVQ